MDATPGDVPDPHRSDRRMRTHLQVAKGPSPGRVPDRLPLLWPPNRRGRACTGHGTSSVTLPSLDTGNSKGLSPGDRRSPCLYLRVNGRRGEVSAYRPGSARAGDGTGPYLTRRSPAM